MIEIKLKAAENTIQSILNESRKTILLINSTNQQFLHWSKLKAFADNKINMTEKLKLVLGSVENIVGKGENAGNQHFLLHPQCFSRAFFFRVIKCLDCVVKSKYSFTNFKSKRDRLQGFLSFH